MPDKTDARADAEQHLLNDADHQHFACLLFGADDEVRWAEIFEAPRKAVAMQRAMSLLRTTGGCVGFQLWHGGYKIAEYYPHRHAVAGRMVSGPEVSAPKPRRS